jgi:GT2 family glycosyltransferase
MTCLKSLSPVAPPAPASPARADRHDPANACASVSVVIPSYRRHDLLRDTIRNVLRDRYPNFEVIVVDQGEADAGEELHREFGDRIRYVRVVEPNLAVARNVGIERSHGDIILFCDDDVVPCVGWISSHARHYSDSRVMAVAGSESVPSSSQVDRSVRRAGWKRMLFRLLVSGQNISGMLTGKQWRGRVGNRIVAQFTGTGAILHDWTVSGTAWVDFAKGCNMSLRREVFTRVGGFDPRCTGREEADLFLRLKRVGIPVMYDSAASVLHLKDQTGGSRISNPKDHYRWVFYFECYFFLKNFPAWCFPFFLMRLTPEIAACFRKTGFSSAWILWAGVRQAEAAARQATVLAKICGPQPLGTLPTGIQK